LPVTSGIQGTGHTGVALGFLPMGILHSCYLLDISPMGFKEQQVIEPPSAKIKAPIAFSMAAVANAASKEMGASV